MKTPPTILQAMEDPDVFAPWFKPRKRWFGKARDSWAAWKVFLGVLFGLPLTDEQRAVYTKFTGRRDTPVGRIIEAVAICGRRAGKSLIAAMICAYLAVFVDYTLVLQPGEMGVVMLLASDRRQATVLLNYIFGFFDSIPMLKRMVVSRTKESITLSNNIIIEVHTSSFKAVRGFTVVAAVCDEIAFWPKEDSASPDTEVLSALRPAMLSVPSALLLIISSPYSRSGALWELHRDNYGKESAPVLVWQADTESMNSTVPAAFIKMAYLRDFASAKAEYGAQFRDDVSGFLSLEAIEQCIVSGRYELPRIAGASYRAFCDPAGGTGADSFTIAISHDDDGIAVLDALREIRPPFSPEQVVGEYAGFLKSFGIFSVSGDKYASGFNYELWSNAGIEYEPSDKNRSQVYLEFLPMLTSGKVQLLDLPRLKSQLLGLERKVGRNADAVDHAPGGHDDLSNACAGALGLVMGDAGVYAVLDMNKDGTMLRLLGDRIAAGAQVVKDVFGRIVANPRNDNRDREKLFPVEAQLRGLDPAKINPATTGVRAQEKAPPCANCKSTCTVLLDNKFHCNQCGKDTPNPKLSQEVMVCGRNGPTMRPRA